jgi:hypothetical protein
MKTILNSLIVTFTILCTFHAKSQAPNQFKYQSIARGSNGNPLPNASIGVRLSIRELSPIGAVIFQESHLANTNEFGLFNLNIGGGNATIGSMGAIDWANGAKFIEVEGDLTGGTNYTSFGTTELLSVPYALYSNSSGSGNGNALSNGTQIGNTLFWDGSIWRTDNQFLYNDGLKVGINTGTPLQKLHVNGNITIAGDSSYMINNKKVLWTKGTGNLFVGVNAGAVNSLGFNNSFLGFNSGLNNLTGMQNTFIGTESGQANFDGSMNSFLGRRAGFSNYNGNENTFIGAFAGQSNTDGLHNSFLGVQAGNSNILGNENTFIGAHSGYYNTTGNNNTFLGNFAGDANVSGSNNTFIGFNTDALNSSLSNVTAIGAEAIATSSNSVVIGNSSVLNIGGQVNWATLSDKRLKQNIKDETLGLDFILNLRPVNYEYKTKGQEDIRYTGLIAQEVDETLKAMGKTFSGVVRPQHSKDFYSVRYAEFVLPLINAVKEQNELIKSLEMRIEQLENELNKD